MFGECKPETYSAHAGFIHKIQSRHLCKVFRFSPCQDCTRRGDSQLDSGALQRDCWRTELQPWVMLLPLWMQLQSTCSLAHRDLMALHYSSHCSQVRQQYLHCCLYDGLSPGQCQAACITLPVSPVAWCVCWDVIVRVSYTCLTVLQLMIGKCTSAPITMRMFVISVA